MWHRLEWYTHKDVTTWFPCRFTVLDPAYETCSDKSLYEFLCHAGYGYSFLRFHTREATPYGVEFRVVDYEHKPEQVLFQGDAWHLACWLADREDKKYPYKEGLIAIPYEIF